MCVKHNVVVAEIEAPFVLGYDFQFLNQCLVDVGRTCIYINGLKFKCLLESGMNTIFRITASENVIIPPRTEVVVSGRIKGEKPFNHYLITEPNARFQSNKGVVVAKALVSVNDNIPIRFANFSNDVKTIQSETVIAIGQPVSDVIDVDIAHNMAAHGHINQFKKENVEIPEHIKTLSEESMVHLNENQQGKVKNLLLRYSTSFATSKTDLGETKLVQHKINTGDSAPIKLPLRRPPLTSREVMNEEVDQMLKHGLIQPSTSPWSSPVVLVKKKDNSVRFCVDYRRLNEITRKDSYPLPRIDDSLDALGGSKWFSTLDLASGYWQVKMHPEDAEKTAFATPQGLFEFTVMPFGLVNAPATFERLMEVTLSGLHWQTCLIYLDDIIVFGVDFDEHFDRLTEVLERIKGAGLKLSPKKCQLFQRKVEFLGYVVSSDGISTDPSKVSAIKEWPIPLGLTGLQSFIGTCSYYRKFVKGFADIARPLHKLAEKGKKFVWSQNSREF